MQISNQSPELQSEILLGKERSSKSFRLFILHYLQLHWGFSLHFPQHHCCEFKPKKLPRSKNFLKIFINNKLIRYNVVQTLKALMLEREKIIWLN